jgi:hypothetical protein
LLWSRHYISHGEPAMSATTVARFVLISLSLCTSVLAAAAPGASDIKVIKATEGPVYLAVQGGAGNPGGLARGVVDLVTPNRAEAQVLSWGGEATPYPGAIGGDAEGVARVVGSIANAYTESWTGRSGNALADSMARGAGESYAGAQAITDFYPAGGNSIARAHALTTDVAAMPRAMAHAGGMAADSHALAQGANTSTPDSRALAFGLDVNARAVATRSGDMAFELRNSASGNVTGPGGLDARANSVMGSPRPVSIQGDVVASANADLRSGGDFLTGRHSFGTVEEAVAAEAFVASSELMFHTGTDGRLSMALLGLVSGSSRLDEASVTILVDGIEMVNRSFSSLGEFSSFLVSGPLDLGALSVGSHAFSLTTRVVGAAQFGYTYALSGVMPVPEPGAWAMWLAGVGMVWLLCLRRKVGIVASHETTATPYGQDPQVHPVLVPGPGRGGRADRRHRRGGPGAGLPAGRSIATALRRLVDRPVQ